MKREDTGISARDALLYWHTIATGSDGAHLDPEALSGGVVRVLDGDHECSNCGREVLTGRTGDDYENTKPKRVERGLVRCAHCGRAYPIERGSIISASERAGHNFPEPPRARARSSRS